MDDFKLSSWKQVTLHHSEKVRRRKWCALNRIYDCFSAIWVETFGGLFVHRELSLQLLWAPAFCSLFQSSEVWPISHFSQGNPWHHHSSIYHYGFDFCEVTNYLSFSIWLIFVRKCSLSLSTLWQVATFPNFVAEQYCKPQFFYSPTSEDFHILTTTHMAAQMPLSATDFVPSDKTHIHTHDKQ